MPIRKPPADFVTRMRRRALLATTLRHAARQAWIGALVAVAAFGAARSFQAPVSPELSWLSALLPLGLLAWLTARRVQPGSLEFAALADQRVGARGLLLLAGEREIGAWQDRLGGIVAAAEPPSVDWARPCAQIVAAVAVVAALGWVPLPTVPIGSPRQVAIQGALERLRDEMKAALVAESLSPPLHDDLATRAKELEQRVLDGDPVTWADVDTLQDALARQESVQRNGLAQLIAHAGDLAAAVDEKAPLDGKELAELARLAEQLGLGLELSPELKDALDRLSKAMDSKDAREEPGGGLDAAALAKAGLDPKQLRALAEQLQKLGGNRLSHAARGGRVPEPELSDLRKLLDKEGVLGAGGAEGDRHVLDNGGEFDPTPREGQEGGQPGRGGVSRGRGDAALDHSGDTEIDTAKLKPERLAPGEPYHDRWENFGVLPSEPTSESRTISPGGGDAALGAGDATYHRDLAPRHRDVVRRFFTPDSPPRRR